MRKLFRKTSHTLIPIVLLFSPFLSEEAQTRTTLESLSVRAYSGAFSASLQREFQVSDVLLARPLDSLPLGHWVAFALPFSTQLNQNIQRGQVGYTLQNTGIILGAEHNTPFTRGLSWGFHGVVDLQEKIVFASLDNASGTLQGWGIGIQGHYTPNPDSGFYLEGYGRIGLDQGSITHIFSRGDYAYQKNGQWLDWTGSSALFGGYLWELSSAFSIGPVVGLTSIIINHPQIVETGSPSASTTLEANSAYNLFSSLGFQSEMRLNKDLKILLETRWDRALLNTSLTQESYFTHHNTTPLYTKIVLFSYNSFDVNGQLTYKIHPNVTLGASLGAQFMIAQAPLLSGNLLMGIRF
jgi:hypothetical protein